MSHIYQPVMLIELLGRQGSASTTEIAKALLGHDVSQVEYYEHITNNMVDKDLTRPFENDVEGVTMVALCHHIEATEHLAHLNTFTYLQQSGITDLGQDFVHFDPFEDDLKVPPRAFL